jgi:hypothetical protein
MLLNKTNKSGSAMTSKDIAADSCRTECMSLAGPHGQDQARCHPRHLYGALKPVSNQQKTCNELLSCHIANFDYIGMCIETGVK